MGEPRDVFKAYDIRGTVPDQLDAEHVPGDRGRLRPRDRRRARRSSCATCAPSGVALAAAFAEGARSEGAAVTDLGMASTDFLYFASGQLDAPGAMFTASHNPAAYNGIKLCLAGAAPVGEDTGLREIERLTVELPGPTRRRRPPPGRSTQRRPAR